MSRQISTFAKHETTSMTTKIRVLHVLPSYSTDGTTGGPARVAEAQVVALNRHGEDATLTAPTQGNRAGPLFHQPVRLFRMHRIPGLGPAGIFSVRLVLWCARNIKRHDIVHVHLSRDLVTLPIALLALLARVPVVAQPHGMIDRSPRALAKVIDAIATRRILQSVDTILTLSSRETCDIEEVSRRQLVSITELWNTVRVPPRQNRSVTSPPEVVFLARLHERKRPGLFVDAAIELIRQGTDAQFSLIGPDEGAIESELKRIAEAGLSSRITWEGAIPADDVIKRLSAAYLYVLPARNEPFGLTVIESLAAGTPVVISDDAVLSRIVAEGRAGEIFDGTVDDLTRVIASYLSNPSKRDEHSANAYKMATEQFSDTTLGSRLAQIYHNTIDERAH